MVIGNETAFKADCKLTKINQTFRGKKQAGARVLKGSVGLVVVGFLLVGVLSSL